MTFLETRGQL